MARVLFTADTHFGSDGHRIFFKRPFVDVLEMARALIKNWNEVVNPRDLVYHLGDFGVGDSIHAIFHNLNGHKILVRGNHDPEPVLYLPWADIARSMTITVRGQEIWLAHEPKRGWLGRDRGTWHLHGHSHGRRSPSLGSLDAGVECWDYRPVTFNQIQEMMRIMKGGS
ncbi:MAG: metallophosphoesterase [Deltaproteobacteria bacterium]|nr:metallophosphoesterase [Deltaproteobacteria bacterium]